MTTPSPADDSGEKRAVELLPCPFCGKELRRSPNKINPSAKCTTEDCYGQKCPVVSPDVPSDVEAWNTRASPHPAAPEGEADETARWLLEYASDLRERDGHWRVADRMEWCVAALRSRPAEGVSEKQIKHMVDRFLGWRLPENFNPDGGVSFEQFSNKGTVYEYKFEPIGTNLFGATQATEMVRYMIEGMPIRAQ